MREYIEGIDYIVTRIEHTPFSLEKLLSHRKKERVEPMHFRVRKRKDAITDEQLCIELSECGDLTYDKLPSQLKHALLIRQLYIDKRDPTDEEMQETEEDGVIHRITHKELTVQDYLNHYLGKRNCRNV